MLFLFIHYLVVFIVLCHERKKKQWEKRAVKEKHGYVEDRHLPGMSEDLSAINKVFTTDRSPGSECLASSLHSLGAKGESHCVLSSLATWWDHLNPCLLVMVWIPVQGRTWEKTQRTWGPEDLRHVVSPQCLVMVQTEARVVISQHQSSVVTPPALCCSVS